MIGAGAGGRKRLGGASRLIFLGKMLKPRRPAGGCCRDSDLRAVDRGQAELDIDPDAGPCRFD